MSQDRKISIISEPDPIGPVETQEPLEDTPFRPGSQTSDPPAESGSLQGSDGWLTGNGAFRPGPWEAVPTRKRDHGALPPVFEDGLWNVVEVGAPEWRVPVAVVDAASDHDEPTRQRAQATARLIAAAPQMLDSLLAVEWAGTGFTEDADDFDCCPNCGAAMGSLHTPSCELRDALDAALGVTSPRVEVAGG